ncbi:hypothetical protein [Jiella sp. M17.18]|uniref:hypothetical protein n=1 Tax=Jiella sp. M17.18 TaxID=3234247 RepID=UPI0034E04EE6
MIIIFDRHVQKRLDEIEAAEGIPPVDFVRQAVEAWSLVGADDRRAIAISIMHIALSTVRRTH